MIPIIVCSNKTINSKNQEESRYKKNRFNVPVCLCVVQGVVPRARLSWVVACVRACVRDCIGLDTAIPVFLEFV